MNLIGVIIGFATIIVLNRKLKMGVSLLIGSLVTAVFTGMALQEITLNIYNSVVDTMTLQLMIIITIISGLGYLLEKTGDLDLMIDSLISLFKNGKLLSMIIPAIIGTLAVPGGAILSAPMIEESGERINLSNHRKTSINLFFRHIGFFIYPLYGALIITAELFKVSKLTIIKYNSLIMLGGLLAAYIVLFNEDHYDDISDYQDHHENIKQYLFKMISSFSPIIIILVLALAFQVPFYIAVFAGVLIGVSRNINVDNKLAEIWKRLKDFFVNGIDYNLAVLIIGIMVFKGIIEASGSVNYIAEFLSSSGIPLPMMMVVMGLITGSLTGVNTASMGILIPVFISLIPADNPAPYISLLFTSSLCGYLLSPIHLCLVLTKEYFKSGFIPVYQQLGIPVIVMITIALLQLVFFV